MGRFQETIGMPSGVNVSEASRVIQSILAEKEQFEVKSVEEKTGEITINAKAKPNLFSWGEEIWIQIRQKEIEIISENTSQLIDWNRPQKNVRTIVTEFRSRFNQKKNPA